MAAPTGRRPLLFLDVDGPLIPFGRPSGAYATYTMTGMPPEVADHPLLPRLDPAHGPRLAGLACDLVWATAWEGEANTYVAPRLGLPRLPVVEWPAASPLDDHDMRTGLHWKTRTLVAYADERPFAWVDDEITGVDTAWVAARFGARALLHRVDPGEGLSSSDYAELAAWLRDAGAAPGRDRRG